jgi:ribose 5-phosphate isomerase A
MDRHKAAKEDAARRSLAHVRAGMTLGLGTGSTARLMIEALGEEVRRGLSITAVPSSEETAALARARGIPLATLDEVARLDLVIDGADEVTSAGEMVKGRGGALLREKVLATMAARVVIVVDPSKLVAALGARGLPVEVVPFARAPVARRLEGMGFVPELRRTASGAPFLTDQGNEILDCETGPIADPAALARQLDEIVGLVEHGLFLGFGPELVVGRADP